MLDGLKTLNSNIETACLKDGDLYGCTQYKNTLTQFTEFPAVATKLISLPEINTNAGTIVITEEKIVLTVSDLLGNHENDLVTLYDESLQKLNIMFGIANARTEDKEIDVLDVTFRGSSKGCVFAITINI